MVNFKRDTEASHREMLNLIEQLRKQTELELREKKVFVSHLFLSLCSYSRRGGETL
jgi:hypothetical protein